jgi:hypothetical protein
MGARFGGRVYSFPGCLVEVSPGGRRVETRWPDGVTLAAVPHATAEYRERAVSLGYSGDDPAAQCNSEHDRCHLWLCWQLGVPESPVLRALAEGQTPEPDACGFEEDLVLAWQRYANTGEQTGPLRFLKWLGWDLPRMRERWAALLAGETG